MTEPDGDLKLLVVDDQAAIREALATMLDMTSGLTVVGTASDGEQAVAAVRHHRPDVVLMDLRMPRMDGIAATSAILREFPDTAVVVLTTFDDDSSIIAALGAGARGYLTKQAGRADIARAVRAAAAGQAVLDPAVQARLVSAAGGFTPTPTSATASAPSEPAQPASAGAALPDGSRPGKRRCCGSSPPENRTGRSPENSSSARRRSRPTSTTCSPKPACATAPRPCTTRSPAG